MLAYKLKIIPFFLYELWMNKCPKTDTFTLCNINNIYKIEPWNTECCFWQKKKKKKKKKKKSKIKHVKKKRNYYLVTKSRSWNPVGKDPLMESGWKRPYLTRKFAYKAL